MSEDEQEAAFLSKFYRPADGPRPAYAFPTNNIAEEMEKIPLFMTKLPDNPDDNPQLVALQSLLYEGPAEEIALNFKQQGNEAFKEGKFHDAREYYRRGIEQECSDRELHATLLANRAACNLLLKNYRACVEDCEQAATIWPAGRTKVWIRATKAHLALDHPREALQLLNQIAVEDPDHGEISTLTEQANLKLKSLEEREHKQEVANRLQARINGILSKRGVQSQPGCEDDILTMFGTVPDQLSLPRVGFAPHSASILAWPCLFLYPPYGQSDFVEAWDERITLQEQLATIFAQPAPWDTDRLYAQGGKQVEVYWNRPSTRELWRVKSSRKLQELFGGLIKQVDRGILAFYLLPSGNPDALTRFLARFDPPTVY